MATSIIKRSGKKEQYQGYKIEEAIRKAFHSSGTAYNRSIYEEVEAKLSHQDSAHVEEIQDMIERALFRSGYFDTAKAFITYRFLHKMQREQLGGLYSGNTYVDCKQTVEEYIGQSDWRIAANSNTTYSNAGLINNTAGKVIANYWLDQVYSAREGAAHREGDYHIHDLDCLTGYCAGWSLRNLLNEGFNGVRSRVNSRPPRHFREALGQMANFLGILQSEWAGAQAFSSFDTFLAPYVFKDQTDFPRIKKDIRSFVYNLNVPSRWGQSPFTNVTIDWTVPRDLRDQAPFSGGEHLFEGIEDANLLALARERGAKSRSGGESQYRNITPSGRSPFSFFLIPKNNASLIHLRRKVPRPPCHDPFLEPAPLFRRQDRKPGKTLRRLYLPLFRIPHRKSRPPPLRTTAGNAMQNNSSAPWGE